MQRGDQGNPEPQPFALARHKKTEIRDLVNHFFDLLTISWLAFRS